MPDFCYFHIEDTVLDSEVLYRLLFSLSVITITVGIDWWHYMYFNKHFSHSKLAQ